MPEVSQPRVYVTDASAGSGKTYALAIHYLRLLLNNSLVSNQIENTLAITFTNKAAREMKERIIELLKKTALNKFTGAKEESQILSGLSIEKKEARIKAIKLMDYIIANYNYFQIRTIDSFINMILLGCAYRLNLSANFQIREDRQDYLAYSLDECIDRANHDKQIKKVFDAFLKQYTILKEKSSWFPKADILGLVGALFYHSNIYGGNFKKFDLKGRDIYKEKQEVLKLYRSLYDELPGNVHGTFRNLIRNFVENHQETFDFGEITASKIMMREEILMKAGPLVPDGTALIWKTIREKNSELAEAEARSLFNCYIDIFNLVYGVLRSAASKDDVLFLEELNQQAHALINENGVTVPELYYQLASRLRHFLIDEFQDTSVLQWRNLFPMIEETLSKGGSLFYVGDKKQAIFRFRGGEVSLFEKIKESFSSYVSSDFLSVNYRSQKEIVDFNNAVFGRDNLQRFLSEQEPQDSELKQFSAKDINEILEVFSGSKQEYKKDGEHEYGYVKVELIEASDKENKKELIKERLLALIVELKNKARFSLKDIAVLCRDNSEIELVSGWLIGEKIPVESDKTLNVKNNSLIKELAAFLAFLNSPIDNLSFVSFVFGDIFLKASGMNIDKIKGFLFGLKDRISNEQGFYVYREFKKVYPDIWDNFIEGLFKRIGFIGLYELTIDIYSRYDVFKNFPGQQGFFMHFLQLVKDSEEECKGIADFFDYFKELDNFRLYVNSSDAEAVKVTTIHKAKGLGFGVVVLPFFEFDINYLGAQDTKIKVSYVVEKSDGGISLIRLDKKYALLCPSVYDAYKKEYQKSFVDELNTIYVALTRARNELYIFVPHGMERTNNIARFLIPQDYFKRGNIRAYKNNSLEETYSLVIEPPRYRDWNSLLQDEFCDLDTIKNRQNVAEGKILHEILAYIGNLIGQNQEKALKVALLKAKLLFPFVGDLSNLAIIVKRLLSDDAAKKFFYVDEGEAYQEKEVVGQFGDTKRIDRLIVKEKEVWIIDYKSRHDDALYHKEQLGAYKKIIQGIYSKKIVKCFLIFLEDTKIEELNG